MKREFQFSDFSYLKQIEVVAAIIHQDGKILATQRGYGDYKGWWEFPGGKMERNETAEVVIARALDEITSMKILSRIEGDETKVSKGFLTDLGHIISYGLSGISGKEYSDVKGKDDAEYSVSLAKLEEMKKRLDSGYTSFWN